ncbi:hypothetical protein MNBD_GAMMA08-2979, partial [hydrothermal vent metagenome]
MRKEEAQRTFLDKQRIIAKDTTHSQEEERYYRFGLNEEKQVFLLLCSIKNSEIGSNMKIICISGSLREGSYNTALLKTAKEISNDDVQFEIMSICNIPLYNEDIDGAKIPKEVALLIKSITSADALLFSTPEYNHCIPG